MKVHAKVGIRKIQGEKCHVINDDSCSWEVNIILDRSTSPLPNIVQRWDVVLMRHFKASKDNYSNDSQLSLARNVSTWPTWRILGVMFWAQDTERKGRQNNLIKYWVKFTYCKNQVQSKNTSILAYCLVWMKARTAFETLPTLPGMGPAHLCSFVPEHPVKLDLWGWLLPTWEQFVSTTQTFLCLSWGGGLILYLDLPKTVPGILWW